MAADDRFREYTIEVAAIGDLLAETVEMIWQLVRPDQTDEHTRRPLGEVVDELERAAEGWRREVEAGADFSVSRQESQEAVIVVPGR